MDELRRVLSSQYLFLHPESDLYPKLTFKNSEKSLFETKILGKIEN